MKRCVPTLAACALLVAGCDIAYLRQFDVAPPRAGEAISAATDGEVLEVLRDYYAAAHGLRCDGTTALPVSCSRGVYAYRSPSGVTVCFYEWDRPGSERRADELAGRLRRRFGADRIRDLVPRATGPTPDCARRGAAGGGVNAAAAA